MNGLYQEYIKQGGDLSLEDFNKLTDVLPEGGLESFVDTLKKKVNPTENGTPSLTTSTPPSQTDLPILKNPIPENEFNVPLGSEQDLSSPSLGITAEMPSTDLPSTATVSSGVENSNPPQSLVSGIESELRGNNADFPMWRKAFDVIDANKANSENKAISLGDFQSTQNPFIRDVNSTFQIGGMNLPTSTLDTLAGKSNEIQGEIKPKEGFKEFNTTSEFKKYKDGNDALVNGNKQDNPYYGLKQLQGNFSVSVGAGTPNEKTKTLGSDVDGVFEDSTGKKVVDINGNLYDLDDYLNPERDFVESENNQLFNTNGVILTKNQKESNEGKPNVIDALYEFKPIELNTKTFNINNGDPSIVEKQNADLLQLEKEGKIKVYKDQKTDENGNLSWEITDTNFLKEYNDYNAKLYTPSDIDKGYNYSIQRNKILEPILQGAKFEAEAEDRFKEKFGVNAFNRYGVIPDSEMEEINDSLQKEQLLSQGYSEDQAIQLINQEKTNSRQQEVKKGYDFIDTIVKPQLEIRASAMPDSTSASQRSEVEVDEHYQALRQLALNLPEKFNEFAESHKDWDFKKPEMVSAFKNAFIEYVKEDKAYQYAFNDHKIQQANLDVKKGAVNKDVIKVKESREKVKKHSAQLEEQSQYFSQVSELKNEIDSNYFKSESAKIRKDREENRGYRENEAGAIATTTLKRIGDIPFRIAGDWLTTGATLFGASNSTIKDLEIESKPFVGTRQQGITDDVVEYTDDKGNKYEAVNGTDLFYIDKNGQRGIATNESDINSFISGNKLKETNRYKDFNGANFLAEVSKVTADMAVGGGIGKGVGKGVIRTLTKLKAGLSETNYARKGLDMLIASAANPNTTTSYAMAIQYYGGSYKNYQEKGYTNGEARALAIFSTAALANVNRIFPDIKLFQESDQIALNTYRLLASGETSAAKKFLVGKFSEASKRIGGNVIGEVPEETIYEPIAESIVQYMGASISGDRKKMQNIDSSIDFSADTVGLTIGTVLLSGAFGTGKANIDFNKSTPLEKSIFLSKNPEYIETLHNLKNDAIVGDSANKELSAYYTIEKYIDKIPSDNNLNISQTAEVVVKLQKIDALKKEIDKSDTEAFKADIQSNIDVLNGDISTILEQSKTKQTPKNESPNAETAQPTPQSEAVQEQTTEAEQPQVATESEQPTITGEQNVPSELNPTNNGQTAPEIQSTTAEAEENVQPSNQGAQDTANQLPEMGQGIAQSENATQEIALEEEIKAIEERRQAELNGFSFDDFDNSREERAIRINARYDAEISALGNNTNISPNEVVNDDDIVLADDTLDLINSLTDETAPSNNNGNDGNPESGTEVIQQSEPTGETNQQAVSATTDTGTSEGKAEVGNFREENGILITNTPSFSDVKIVDFENANLDARDYSRLVDAFYNNEGTWDKGLKNDVKNLGNGWYGLGKTSDGFSVLHSPELDKTIVVESKNGVIDSMVVNNIVENNTSPVQQTAPFSDNEQAQTLNENQYEINGRVYTQSPDGSFTAEDKNGKQRKVTNTKTVSELTNLAQERNTVQELEKNGYTYRKLKDGTETITSPNGKTITSKIQRRRNGRMQTEKNPQFANQKKKIFGEKSDNEIKVEDAKRRKEALMNFTPTNETQVAMLYFANGGKVSADSVRREIAGKGKNIKEYTWVYLGENADKTFEQVSEKLSENEEQNFDQPLLRSELIEVARSYSSSTEIAEEIVDLYNTSTDPYYGFTDEDAIAMQEAEASKAKMDFYNSVGDVYGLTDEELLDYYKQQYENSINNLTDEQQDQLYTADTQTDSAQQTDKNAGNGNRVSEKQSQEATNSPEYQQLLKDREAQEARVKSTKESLDRVSRNTNKDFQADQENIFGERPQAEGMFDERADGNAGKEIIANAKREYDQAKSDLAKTNKAIRDFESGNASGTGAIDFLFYGERGATQYANNEIDNLVKAKIYEEQGKTPKEILDATGWFKGAEGKWRKETDNKFTFSFPNFQLEDGDLKRMKLKDVLNYPQLFKLYPRLENVNLVFRNENTNNYADTNGFNTITVYTDGRGISASTGNKFAHTTGAIIHEIQHIIQSDERFASGYYEGITRELLSPRVWGSGMENPMSMSLTEYARMVEKRFGKEWRNEYEAGRITAKEIGDYLYENTAGEVEAFNAQRRSQLTEEQLRNELPKLLNVNPDELIKSLSPVSNFYFKKPFTPIPQSTYDKLVNRLLGVFKKFGGKVITTKAEVDAKLKEFGYEGTDLQNITPIKSRQLEIINRTNPAPNNYNTWVRSESDILTAEEAFRTAFEDGEMYPDFTVEDMQQALDSGFVTVYSSKPIEDGNFVTPSKMNAQEYAGGKNGKVYSQKVKTSDIAWIDESEGQYARIEFMKTKDGEIYGAKFPDGTIYLNPEKINANTPIHEFSHLWQQLMPARFKKGVELLKNTPIGKKTFAELKANEGYANKSDEELWNEALVTVMGNEGERVFNSSKASKFKEWITDLFKALGNAFGIRDLSPNDKLSTFVKGALSEVMGTKEIIPESSVEQKEVPIYIKKMSNVDLRNMLDRLGLVMDAVCP